MKALSLVLGFVVALISSVFLTVALAERTPCTAHFSPLTIHRITRGQHLLHRIGMCSYCQPARNGPGSAIAPNLGPACFAGGSAARPTRKTVTPNPLSINP